MLAELVKESNPEFHAMFDEKFNHLQCRPALLDRYGTVSSVCQ